MLGFGTSTFGSPAGQQQSTGFGSSSFGTPQFGTPQNPTPSSTNPAGGGGGGGFGGFGQQTPTNTGGFGSNSQQTPTGNTGFGGFGTNTQQSKGGFGTSATTSSNSPFGSPPAVTNSSGFGASNTGGFGQQQQGGFGTSGNTTGGFGSNASGGGGFGSTSNTFGGGGNTPGIGGFGTNTTNQQGNVGGLGSPFGQSNNTNAGGGFGQQQQQQQQQNNNQGGGKGTSYPSYTPYINNDDGGTQKIIIHSIVADPKIQNYCTKSFEELRFEDYELGRKSRFDITSNPTQQSSSNTGGFGQPASTTGGFGQSGQQSSTTGFGGFGGSSSSTTTTTTGFGQPAQQPSTGFGGFGSSPSTATTTGGFGQPAAPAATGGFGGFGSSSTTTSGFGQQPAANTGGFGASTQQQTSTGFGGFGAQTQQPTTASTGGFGQPSTTGGFGQTATSGFGGFGTSTTPAAPAATGGFGGFGTSTTPAAPAATGGFGGFGTSTTPASGGFSGFGTTAPATAPSSGGFGGFGTTPAAPTTGGFGTTPAAPASGGFGGFGTTPAAPASGGFGSFASPQGQQQQQQQQQPQNNLVSSGNQVTADTTLASKLQTIETQRKNLSSADGGPNGTQEHSQYQHSPSHALATSLSSRDAAALVMGEQGGSFAQSGSALRSYQHVAKGVARVRPRGMAAGLLSPTGSSNGSIVNGSVITPNRLGGGGAPSSGGGGNFLSPDSYLGSSTKKLVIREGALTPKPRLRLQLTNGGSSNAQAKPAVPETDSPTNASSNKGGVATPVVNPPSQVSNNSNQKQGNVQFTSADRGSLPSPQPTQQQQAATPGSNSSALRSAMKKNSSFSGDKEMDGEAANNNYNDFYNQVVSSPEPLFESRSGSASRSSNNGVADYVPKLSKEGYIVTPPLPILQGMSELELATLSNFSISRPSVGKVEWEGAVDVRFCDIDSVVQIEEKEVAVYDDEENRGDKPPVGSQLNRPAIITLYNIRAKDGSDGEAVRKFARKIEKQTVKMGAELVDYNSEDGIWIFRTKHFSRYGLDSDDEDEEDVSLADKAKQQQAKMQQESLALLPLIDDVGMMDGGNNNNNNNKMDFNSGGRGGRSPGLQGRRGGSGRGVAPESKEEMILRKAEMAYGTMNQMKVSAREVSPLPGDFDERFSLNAYDGSTVEEEEEYVLPKPIPPQGDLPIKPSNPGEGMCAKLARKAGLPQQTVRRYSPGGGGNLCVSWGPNNELVYVHRSSPRHVVITKPVFAESRNKGGEPSGIADERCINFLEVHLMSSERTYGGGNNNADEDDEMDDDSNDDVNNSCPTFSLPQGLGVKGGDQSVESYRKLCKTLDEYTTVSDSQHYTSSNNDSSDVEVHKLPQRAFSLLAALYGQEDNFTESNILPVDEAACSIDAADRRLEGFKLWLRSAISTDVEASIKFSGANSPEKAIFAALSSGDVARASDLALKSGCTRLATLIPAGYANRNYLREQLLAWENAGAYEHIDPSLLRIYSLLSGELETEGVLFKAGRSDLDWRRRLALHVFAGEAGYEGARLSIRDAINRFDGEVRSGLAPIPEPRCVNNVGVQSGEDTKCLLYRLLRLRAGAPNGSASASLAEVVSPSGYTTSTHDYSLAFHVASLLSSLGCASAMTVKEALDLCQSFAGMLVTQGDWHYGIYVMLCAPTLIGTAASAGDKKKIRDVSVTSAKDVVLRHGFPANEENADDCNDFSSKRKFLEERVGIPKQWIDEARAIRFGYLGDSINYCKMLVSAGLIEKAVAEINILLLGREMFEGGKKAEKLKVFLRLVKEGGGESTKAWHQMNGCGPVLRFLELLETLDTYSVDYPEELLEEAKQLSFKLVGVPVSAVKAASGCMRQDVIFEDELRSAAFTEIEGKLREIIRQLVKKVNGGEIDMEEINNYKDLLELKGGRLMATLVMEGM